MQSISYTTEERRMLRDAKSALCSSNWPDLSPDLLRLIYKKLYDTFDFINFRAVCKSWLAAAPLSEHPPQFPYVLERKNFRRLEFKLHSFHTGKTRRIQVPEARNKFFFGQSQGYLATYNSSSLTLLNPFTKAELRLPFTRFLLCRPLHVGPNPIRNSDDLVMYMILGYGCEIMWFWKTEDNKWALKGDLPGCVEAYHKGRLIFSDFDNDSTTIMDLNTGDELEVRLPSNIAKHDFFCLGEGADAFLVIQRHFRSCTGYEDWSVENCWFEVYQLDEKQKPPCWVKLSDICDLMIFLNSDESGNSGFCLSASDFDGFKGNCIYFTRGRSEEEIHDSRMLIGLYELGKHNAELIGELESEGTWIVPNVY